MKFSIITVCYNSAGTIRKTFDSLLQQTCRDYEYIVIDGGSVDGTVDIIRSYESKFQGRMRWISEPDHGIYDAMNKGLRLASGDFINMMNSDDRFESGALQAMAQAMEESPGYDVYYGIERMCSDTGREDLLIRHSHRNLRNFSLRHQAVFVSRQLHLQYGGYRGERFPLAADYDFLLRIYLMGCKFFPVDRIISVFSMAGVSSLDPFASLIDFHRVKYLNLASCFREKVRRKIAICFLRMLYFYKKRKNIFVCQK